MKIRNALSLLLFLVSSNIYSQWLITTVLQNEDTFIQMCAVDSNCVWGVATSGFYGDTTFIYKYTPNHDWYKLPMQSFMYPTQMTCIAAVDSLKAWVGTDNGKIYSTTDGGFNWTEIYSFGGSGFINDIKFSPTNKMVGYANSDPPNGTGTPFKILKTTNGGANWEEFSPVLTAGYNGAARSSSVTDANHYWFGLSKTGSVNPRLAYTTDGGVSWQVRSISYNSGFLWPIEMFQDNLLGFCSAENYYPVYLFKTTDGGNSWFNFYSINIEAGLWLSSLNHVEGTYNWYLSTSSISNPPIYKSTNNGQTWNPMNISHANQQLGPMCFTRNGNRIRGFACTLTGTMYELFSDTAYLVNVENIGGPVPEKFYLEQNYPNPFNPVTRIKFYITGNVTGNMKNSLSVMKVYDMLGREVTTLVNERLQPGTYEVTFDGSGLNSGVYYCRLTTGEYTETKKMILLK